MCYMAESHLPIATALFTLNQMLIEYAVKLETVYNICHCSFVGKGLELQGSLSAGIC